MVDPGQDRDKYSSTKGVSQTETQKDREKIVASFQVGCFWVSNHSISSKLIADKRSRIETNIGKRKKRKTEQ